MVLENSESQNLKNEVWLGEDGIIRAKLGEKCGADDAEEIAKEIIRIARTLPNKPSVSIDIAKTSPSYDIIFRKKVVELLQNAFKDPGLEKVALWGTKNKIIEVVATFILGATGLKNIRYFKTEEEVMEWLK